MSLNHSMSKAYAEQIVSNWTAYCGEAAKAIHAADAPGAGKAKMIELVALDVDAAIDNFIDKCDSEATADRTN